MTYATGTALTEAVGSLRRPALMRSGPAGGDGCNDVGGFGQVVSVSHVPHSVNSIPLTVGGPAESGATAEFEVFYRANVEVVTAYFARRCSEPQLVADLTSDVFLQALASLDS